MQHAKPKTSPRSRPLPDYSGGGSAGFITIRHGARTDGNERRRNAARRVVNGRTNGCGAAPTLTLRGRIREGAARLTAFHRGTCGSEPTPPLSDLSPKFHAAMGRVS